MELVGEEKMPSVFGLCSGRSEDWPEAASRSSVCWVAGEGEDIVGRNWRETFFTEGGGRGIKWV